MLSITSLFCYLFPWPETVSGHVVFVTFRKFLKPDVDGKEGADLIAVDCEKADSWLLRNEMEIGSGPKRVLASRPDDKRRQCV